MSARTLGLVVNPTAGRGRGRAAGQRTATILRAAGHAVVDLSAADAATALDAARAAVHAHTIDALVVVGGDGMVHLGANAVAGTDVPLGLVATGTGNDAARELALPVRDVPAAVATLLDALAHGRTRPLDAGLARTATGDRWFVGVLSAGLDAAVNARANTLTWPRGRARYVRAVALELARFRPYGYRIVSDERTWDAPGTLVAVANGPAIGGGIRIAPTAAFDDGWLDVVLAAPFSRARVVTIFPGMYRGTHLRVRGVHTFRTRAITLEATHAGAPPPHAFADGERLGPLPVRVEVVPGALHLLA
ncbi:diacylglycerol kinase [Sediminihabitans luteus]|uniref:Diacylglycerol kinase n=1 Tax=Sediminihabitans luteus TaxID=1138585 RepID=A0A2M9CQP5_9CELL|nr:diacylglycerol kinase family protein [Sediminihabitans luteus]PJJ74260.1 diacylglycerol kinase [Sediminihabitans luteus]GII99113.1 hypothetical protein Slu03_14910 [Sediminihabitans luteus]